MIKALVAIARRLYEGKYQDLPEDDDEGICC